MQAVEVASKTLIEEVEVALITAVELEKSKGVTTIERLKKVKIE